MAWNDTQQFIRKKPHIRAIARNLLFLVRTSIAVIYDSRQVNLRAEREGVTESGGYYSQLLQEYDAIILSASLTEKFSIPASHEPGANQPLKIITATNPSSLIQFPPLTEETASKVIVFTDREATLEPETAKKGIETVVLNQITSNAILEYCKRRGLNSVLLDLRGNYADLEMLLREGIEQNLMQKVIVEVLPVWHEGDGGNTLALLNGLQNGLEVKKLQPKISSQSIVLEGYLRYG
ncbi:riboflavin biosynthesis protein PYRD, chloroplastic-like [Pistacia vera]|uniref:riboflavin biosynthesis protein PYRD, chloroplastic-like n=1 Tax=Pistacia vera TaxID=55513 RepID=UPI0012635689|nr:riboflavin biosynthesis protein PYRD, chloroplastic-like [Pistacia vera]